MLKTLQREPLRASKPIAVDPNRGAWLDRSILLWAGLGGLLLWAAFPPLAWGVLAWPAMALWIWVAGWPRQYTPIQYRSWYLVGFAHWLLVIHWIRLPHWSAWLGWILLAAYLASYVLVFVWLVRVARSRHIPIMLAAPAIWTGLELIRGHFLTGLSISLLGHTQVNFVMLIQLADIFGAYGVGFLVVLVGACLAECLTAVPLRQQSGEYLLPWRSIVIGSFALLISLIYGALRLSVIERQWTNAESAAKLDVALIQGSIDTTFTEEDSSEQTFLEYAQLTREALRRFPDASLIIWPESMFTYPMLQVSEPIKVPDEHQRDPDNYRQKLREWKTFSADQSRRFVAAVGRPMILGVTRIEFGPERIKRYNTAAYYDRQGQLQGVYDKMRPVMFGEYVPLGNVFPSLYRLTPMGEGLEAGEAAQVFEVDGVRLSPSICFENTIPHLLRKQYLDLLHRDLEPDALVTVTNDGWFWGSSLLDIHLACAVFRAVESRRPMLIAANTGFSAWIDSAGRIQQRGPRRDQGVLYAEVRKLPPSDSVYLRWGDLPAAACALFVGGLVILRAKKRVQL